MSSPAAAAATSPPSSSSSSQTEAMPPAALLPPAAAAATVTTRDQVRDTEGEAVEEEEHSFAAQGYMPLVSRGEDEGEVIEGGIGVGGMMMPPPAAGGGWTEEEEDEGDSEGERREVDFEFITSRILAQMEAEYTHTRTQGGEDRGVPAVAPAATSVENGVWERKGEERAGTALTNDAEEGEGEEEAAAAGIAGLSLNDGEDRGQNGFPAASYSSAVASSAYSQAPETPQSQDATLPSSTSVLPPPLPRSLPPEKEELIRRVMAGVVLSPQVTPAWATGVDWEGPELKSMLARLQGE